MSIASRLQLIALTAAGLALGSPGRASADPATNRPPAAAAPALSSAGTHWAFQPLPASPRPAADPARSIDGFIRRRLDDAGLSPSREADRATLIRRVAFVLTGLPPTPEAIAAFRADRAPGAYRRMAQGYLTSPRHGERWGQHWLDAAGYADSNGYFSADSDRPLAYRYREWDPLESTCRHASLSIL